MFLLTSLYLFLPLSTYFFYLFLLISTYFFLFLLVYIYFVYFIHVMDSRAYILDPCIQEFYKIDNVNWHNFFLFFFQNCPDFWVPMEVLMKKKMTRRKTILTWFLILCTGSIWDSTWQSWLANFPNSLISAVTLRLIWMWWRKRLLLV